MRIPKRFAFWLTLSSMCVAWATVGATQFNFKDDATTLLLISNPLYLPIIILSPHKWDGDTRKSILEFLRYLNIVVWVVVGVKLDRYLKRLREKGERLLDKTDRMRFVIGASIVGILMTFHGLAFFIMIVSLIHKL